MMPPQSIYTSNDPSAAMPAPQPTGKRRGKWLVLFLILVAAAAAVAWLLMVQKSSDTAGPSAFQTATPAQKASTQYCSLAGTALVCQDIKGATAKKFVLPSFVGTASRIVPSPDGRYYFIQTPANPLPAKLVADDEGSTYKPPDRLYVVNDRFEVVRTLSDGPAEDTAGNYSAVDWAADSKSLVFARSGAAGPKNGKSSLYVFDVPSAKQRVLAKDMDIATLFVTADGERVLVSDSETAAKSSLGLTAINFSDGSKQPVRTDNLKQYMKFYSNYSYDRVNDRLYIVGSDDKGPAMAIAKPVGSGADLAIEMVKVIRDGYAYTPLIAVDDGMFVVRRNQSGLSHGVIRADAGFAASAITPTQQARFGTHGLPALKAAATAEIDAADYAYSYAYDTETPQPLRQFMLALAAKDCDTAAGRFNTISLLAHDNSQQAAIQDFSCDGSSLTRYFVTESDSYRQVAESLGEALPCDEVEKNNLSKVVAPVCSVIR